MGRTRQLLSGGWRLALCLALLWGASAAVYAQEGDAVPEALVGEGVDAPGKAEPEAAETDDQAREAESKWSADGFWSNELRYRHANAEDGNEDALDLFSHVVTDLTYRGKNPLLVRLNGRLVWEMAGKAQPGDLLYDTYDTFRGDLSGRLYEFYLQSQSKGPVQGRVGRMFIDDGVWLQFDGLRVDVDLSKSVEGLQFYAVGGAPVEYRGGYNDSWLAGLVTRGWVGTPRTRWRVDYFHISESFGGINDPSVDPPNEPITLPAGRLDDDLLGFTVWHRTVEGVKLNLYGRLTFLNWDANELHLKGTWVSQDTNWTVLLDWYQLLQRLHNVTNDLSPYVPMLGAYEPFGRVTGRVTYRAPGWIVQAGGSYRTLLGGGEEKQFNHEYTNYYFTLTRFDLAGGRLDLTLTAMGYNSSGDDTNAVGGSLDYRIRPSITLSTGLDYSLWKYDWFRNTEHEDVWSYWLRLRWKARRNLVVEGDFMVDDDRFATYTTFLVKVVVRF